MIALGHLKDGLLRLAGSIATVAAFYTSNVEFYLFQSEDWRRFFGNVSRMPLDETSTFIRSVRRGDATPGFGLASELGNMSGEVMSCRP